MGETLADPTNPWNWVALAGDTIDMATPVAGIGEAIKAYKAANRASDVMGSAKKVNKIHANSLKSPKINYGYALVNKKNEIMKFGETVNPSKRYSKKYLSKKGYKMKILDFGSKSYIHKWQYDMNRYYKFRYRDFPPEIKGRGW